MPKTHKTLIRNWIPPSTSCEVPRLVTWAVENLPKRFSIFKLAFAKSSYWGLNGQSKAMPEAPNLSTVNLNGYA